MNDPFGLITDPELTVIHGPGMDAWGIGPLHSGPAGSRALDQPPLVEDVDTSPVGVQSVTAPEPSTVEPVVAVSSDDEER